MMRSAKWVSAVVIATAALGVAACGDSASDEGGASASSSGVKQLKVAVMYGGSGVDANDYNKNWHDGVAGAVEAYGADSVKVDSVTGVEYGDSGLRTTQRLISQGYDLIIDTLSLEGLDGVCAKSPDVACFAHTTPVPDWPKNVRGFAIDSSQAFYLEGIAGGMLSKTGVIGHVGSVEVPFQKAYVNAIALGCQKINPACKVRVVYVNSYFDPPKAQQATRSLLDAGADVINGFMDDPTPVRIAGQRGAWAFGIYESMEKFNPDKYVTTQLQRPAYEQELTRVLKSVGDGSFAGPGESYAIPDGYEPFGEWGANVPKEVVDRVAKEQQEIADGTPVFTGPLTDTSGKVRLAEGERFEGLPVYSDMDYYVKGVQR